ncbi:MAG: aspartyl protease family protein [Crocinitomicaceae bacterium]|nr:aspartyl protease family protein [Crocinitomicaceae bacterium]
MKLVKILSFAFIFIIAVGCQPKFIAFFQKGEYIPQEELIEIPFEIDYGLIFITAQINQHSYRFLFDTGAPNVISKELASELGAKIISTIKTKDSQDNKQRLDYVKLNQIQIGNSIFANTTAAVADLNQADAIACLNIDGIIGANLMRKAFWQIDNERKVIRISTSIDHLNVSPNSLEIPFYPNNSGTPIMDFHIGKKDIKRLTFDTGSVGFLSIDNTWLKTIRESNSIKAERVAYGASSVGIFGANKKDTLRQLLIDTIKIGQATISNQVVELKNTKSTLLGMSFLRNYLITMDWKNRKIYLLQQKEIDNLYSETFGIAFLKENDKLVVSMIYENSPAALAGIAIGDTVLRINDVNLQQTSCDEYCSIIKLARIEGKDQLSVKIEKNGIARDIVLHKLPHLTETTN